MPIANLHLSRTAVSFSIRPLLNPLTLQTHWSHHEGVAGAKTSVPPQIAALKRQLEELVAPLNYGADMTPAQRDAVLALVPGFKALGQPVRSGT